MDKKLSTALHYCARAVQGSAGRGAKGVFDHLGGLSRPLQGIAIHNFRRELLCKLCANPAHTRTLRSPGAGGSWQAVPAAELLVKHGVPLSVPTGAVKRPSHFIS